MRTNEKELDIAKNIHIIESLKCELLSDLAQLYTGMFDSHSNEAFEKDDIIANMIMVSYILAKRLGISYHSLDMKILNKLRLGTMEDDRQWYSDLISLSKHIEKSRRLD